MTAVILANGLATRMSGAVKTLLPVRDRPFITYLLDKLDHACVNRVIINRDLSSELGNSYRTLQLTYTNEFEPLGTGGALTYALPHFRGDSHVLVLNGDTYCRDLDYYDFFNYGLEHNATIALTSPHDDLRYGAVRVDKNGVITSFHEKAGTRNYRTSVGNYVLSTKLISQFSNGYLSLEYEVLPYLIGAREYMYSGPFIDIGTPESYLEALESLIFV